MKQGKLKCVFLNSEFGESVFLLFQYRLDNNVGIWNFDCRHIFCHIAA